MCYKKTSSRGGVIPSTEDWAGVWFRARRAVGEWLWARDWAMISKWMLQTLRALAGTLQKEDGAHMR